MLPSAQTSRAPRVGSFTINPSQNLSVLVRVQGSITHARSSASVYRMTSRAYTLRFKFNTGTKRAAGCYKGQIRHSLRGLTKNLTHELKFCLHYQRQTLTCKRHQYNNLLTDDRPCIHLLTGMQKRQDAGQSYKSPLPPMALNNCLQVATDAHTTGYGWAYKWLATLRCKTICQLLGFHSHQQLLVQLRDI
jgi:hypothetical protein